MAQDEKTLGAEKYDNGKKIKPTLEKIQRSGEFIPTAIDMIENLKKVGPGMNPTMMNAVGPQALMQALSAVSALFSQNKNQANTDPCSFPREDQTPQQIGECACAVAEDQRTEQQKEDCLAWTNLLLALENIVPSDPQYEEQPVTVSLSEEGANTEAYNAAIAYISNTVIVPVGNSIVSNATTISTIANSVQAPVTSLIVANTTSVNTIANSMISLFIANSTTANSMANSIQTPIAEDLLANATWIAALSTALGLP